MYPLIIRERMTMSAIPIPMIESSISEWQIVFLWFKTLGGDERLR